MNKQRKTSHILNVFQYDADGHVVLPASLTLSIAPGAGDNNSKVPTTAWVRTYVTGLTYLTGNQSITVSGDATGSGTTSINLTLANTAVTPGTYGSATLVPVVTVDSKGRITSVTTASISGALTFTGDVTGTGTTGSSTTLTLANSGVTAGTYTKVTVDSKGRVTVGASATTSDISEGTNLYYTDARVLAYLGANNYATQSYVSTQINNLVAGAPGLLDTLDELAAALGDDANFATTTTTSLGNRLRIDIGTQGLTSTQQGYGRTNLGLGTAALSATGDFATAAQGTKADTAHGWGNHASAGYLTSATAATTYLTQSTAASTYLTSTNAASTYLSQTSASNTYLTLTNAASTYLSQTSASNTYLTLTNAASTYLSQTSASNNYLTLTNAASTYLTQSSASSSYVSLSGSYSNPSWITALGWGKITGTPTTISGYGITNAYTDAQIQNFFNGANAITGYNKSNWDTAYGWGNHAVAGYLTTSSAASTYVSLTGSYANPSWITSLAYSKLTGVPSTFTPSSHTHAISEVTGLQTALDGKQATLSSSPSFDQVITTNNGNGTNFRIGDDIWIGDINVANTFRVQGLQDATQGYIVFGNSNATALGRSGTGALTYGGNVIYHAGNIPTWNQNTTGSAGSVAWSGVTSKPTTLSGYGISDAVYSTTSSFTTAGTGWYRVATTAGDGRGYYYIEVYTTGGNHNPSYLRIEAMGDWGNDKLIAAYTDLGFPANAVRITRTATTTFIEVNFTTTILGASMRVVRLGFDSTVSVLSDSLSAGGGTVQETLSITSKINTASLSINGNTVLHAGNYTSYSPTLTGGNASGTWGISITGNAATVGGYQVSTGVGANTVVVREGNGYVFLNYINSNVSESENPTINSFFTSNGDGYLRKSNIAHVRSQLGNYGSWITSSSSITGAAARLSSRDVRTIAPNSENAAELRFGFTSWTNNNSAPYADYLHLRSYSDSSGGSDNLVMFLKSGIGMRIWQQSWNSGTAYSSYADVWHSGNFTPGNYLPLSGGTLTGQLTITGARLLLQTGGINTYGLISGYNNNNHFMTMRGAVSGSTDSPSITGSHQMTFIEYAEANDTTGWFFKSSSTGTYQEIARITRTGINWNGNTVIHAGNIGSYTAGAANSVAWSNVTSKPGDIMYYAGFTLNADSMPSNSTGFTYSDGAPLTGPIVRFSTGGGYDLQINAPYYWGNEMYFRVRNGDLGVWRGWKQLLNAETHAIASRMNQDVRTTDNVTFNAVTISANLNLPNNGLVVVNGETDTWGARFRTTTSTTNLGASLKNIIWCGGGSNEGFAISGVSTGGASFEVTNAGNAFIKDSLYANAVNSRIQSGSTSTAGMLYDSSGRPALVARGAYPHIEIWADVANSNHGATLRFGGYDNGSSGNYKNWNIGTPGSDLYFLDIAYGGSNNSNPHSGIAGLGAAYGYSGAFNIMRFHNNGNVGIGNFGTYGSGDNTPAYKLDVRGVGRFTGILRADAATGGASGQNTVVAFRVAGLSDYPSLELGIEDNYVAVLRSYGNSFRYYAGHWRTVGQASSENHSHTWYTARSGSTDWSTAKMILDHNALLTVTGSISTPVGIFTNDGSSRVLYLRGSGNIIQFQDGGGTNKWEVVGRDGNFYVYKNDGTGSGYRWQIDSSGNHTIYGVVSIAGTMSASEGTFGSTGGATDQGIQIRYQNYGSGYGRIRFYQSDSNHMTIHAFSAGWQGGSLAGHSTGAINIAGQNGVTFGGWNNVDAYIAAGGNIWGRYDIIAYSDIRVKDNIEIIKDPLVKLNTIRGVTFTRKDHKDKNKRHAGVIAQEILPVLPEVVNIDDQGMYSVAYGNLNALLIEAIKEQQLQIEDLKNKLDLFTQNK